MFLNFSEDKMRQRVHGSTDLYGNEKPSYRLLADYNSKNKATQKGGFAVYQSLIFL